MRVYLDNNASYGKLPGIEADLLEALSHGPLYNPGSIHSDGQRARALVEGARDILEELLGIASGEARVIFTSGATESNNQAIFLPFWRSLNREAHLITTAIEHPCILEPAARLKSLGVKVTKVLPEEGRIRVEQIINALTPDTKLVSVMLANNETGQLLPVREISAAIRERAPKCLIHSDVAQVVGKIPFTFSDIGVDMVSISGHKFGSLTGTGALVVRDGIEPESYIAGGAQEQRWRSGTENTAGIYSMGLAAKYVHTHINERKCAMEKARDYLKNELLTKHPELQQTTTDKEETLPNTLHLLVPSVNADDLVVALDLEGVSISSGSACSSGKPLPSQVLLAMGYTEEQARQAIRISVSAEHSETELKFAAEKLCLCIERMK